VRPCGCGGGVGSGGSGGFYATEMLHICEIPPAAVVAAAANKSCDLGEF